MHHVKGTRQSCEWPLAKLKITNILWIFKKFVSFGGLQAFYGSAGASEMLAISSLFTFNVYRRYQPEVQL